MRNKLILTALGVVFMPVFATAQNSVATYTLPNTGVTPQWALIGTFSAGQNGNTVMITAYIHQGYNASVSQDSMYVITFNSSNGQNYDANGFAGDGSWYSFGYNNAIAPGNIKWVANAPSGSATAFSLYIYLPVWTGNSQYTVSTDQNSNWANVGSIAQADPGSGSSTVMIPPVGFNIPYGNVGIGTTAPGAKLDVDGVSDTTSYIVGRMSSAASGYPAYLQFTDGTSYNYALGTANNGDMTFVAGRFPGSAGTERVRITEGGSVGIGTTSPGAALEVNGSIKLTTNSGSSITFQDGTTQSTAYTGVTCGGDYAESVDVTGDRKKYEPGDVLVVDPNAPGRFLKANEPYSSLVAGIYSTKPGTVGRRQLTPKSPDEVPMAMMGIVPTKVTAENGSIKTGDLLVASSTPGMAMKGTDRTRLTGAVIGKALGKLDSGTGVIEVLVTLQ